MEHESLRSKGYSFVHDRDGRVSYIYAKKDGEQVGRLAYGEHPNIEDRLMAGIVEVDELHRRQGIATEMYRLAEDLTGQIFAPSYEQNKDSESLWSQSRRPFGKD